MNDYVYKGKYPNDTYLISQKHRMIIKIWNYQCIQGERKVCYYIILAVNKDRGIYKDNINRVFSHEEYIYDNVIKNKLKQLKNLTANQIVDTYEYQTNNEFYPVRMKINMITFMLYQKRK